MEISYDDILSKIDEGNLFSNNLTAIDSLSIENDLIKKIEASKWCLGLIDTLQYHVNINGIVVPKDDYTNSEVDETDNASLDTDYELGPANQVGFIMLPARGPGWITSPSSPDRDRWGRPEVVKTLIAVAEEWKRRGNTLPLVYGDISRPFGGKFSPHVSHRIGIDVDMWPIATIAGNHNTGSKYYSREKTKELIYLFKHNGITAIEKIGFQDPAFVKEGLTRDWPGHRDHLHLRFVK